MEERYLKISLITSAQLSEESHTLLQRTLVQMTLQNDDCFSLQTDLDKIRELVTQLCPSTKIVYLPSFTS